MKNYKSYMDERQVSQSLHEKLLGLEDALSTTERTTVEKKGQKQAWSRWGLLAACCVLVLGLGLWKAAPDRTEEEPSVYTGGSPVSQNIPGFVVEGDGSKLMFPNLPAIHYPERNTSLDISACIALPDGSFDRQLTKEQIAGILWGPDGRPEADNGKNGSGDLPWMLFWEGYTLSGRATYDGEGKLFWLFLWGEHPDGGKFTLELSPDQLPPTDLIEPGRETTEVRGVAVTGWSQSYDRNGDGVIDYVCGSQFVANGVGVRFENTGSPFTVDSGSGPDQMAAAQQFNALLVNWATYQDGGLSLDHLLTCDDIPDWRVEKFSSLTEARQEAEFAPYLPTKNIPGYGEFFGRLEYQEEREKFLFVRWSRGYDEVEVDVDRSGKVSYDLVDAANPASYDVRRYEIPWYDSVPEEYRNTISRPTFRAEDMTREIVEARTRSVRDAGDSGGPRIDFLVLHPDGTLVSYYCKGLSAEQVWAMVAETLSPNS